MHKALHLRDNDDRLYIKRKKGVELISLEDCVDVAVEYSPMVRETRVLSQVESFQRFKKCYLIPPCLTLSIIIFTNPSARAGYDTRSIF